MEAVGQGVAPGPDEAHGRASRSTPSSSTSRRTAASSRPRRSGAAAAASRTSSLKSEDAASETDEDDAAAGAAPADGDDAALFGCAALPEPVDARDKEKLEAGDRIMFWLSIYKAGDPRGKKEAVVWAVDPDSAQPLTLSVEAETLTLDKQVRRTRDAIGNAIDEQMRPLRPTSCSSRSSRPRSEARPRWRRRSRASPTRWRRSTASPTTRSEPDRVDDEDAMAQVAKRRVKQPRATCACARGVRDLRCPLGFACSRMWGTPGTWEVMVANDRKRLQCQAVQFREFQSRPSPDEPWNVQNAARRAATLLLALGRCVEFGPCELSVDSTARRTAAIRPRRRAAQRREWRRSGRAYTPRGSRRAPDRPRAPRSSVTARSDSSWHSTLRSVARAASWGAARSKRASAPSRRAAGTRPGSSAAAAAAAVGYLSAAAPEYYPPGAQPRALPQPAPPPARRARALAAAARDHLQWPGPHERR